MSLVSGLINSAAGIAPYALRASRNIDDRNKADALQKIAQARQQKQDDLAAALSQATTGHLNAQTAAASEGQWDKPFQGEDENGPGLFQQHKQNGEVRRVKVTSGASAAPPPVAGPTAPATTTVPPVSMAGVSDSQDMGGGGIPTPPPQEPVAPRPQVPGAPTKTPLTGMVKPYVKPSVAPTRIDPNSPAGISADSAKAANRAALKPVGSGKIDPNSAAGITADSTKAANRAALKPGGMTGGMGSGGIGGLARTASAITELDQAHQNMTPFEEQVRNKSANYTGLDYFTGMRGKMYDSHGVVDQATHAAAFAQLNKVNPDLANYLRAAEMWALADGGISGRTSDFRTKLDGFVSAIGPNAGGTQIDNTQRGRVTRLAELHKFQPAMEAAAQRFVTPPGGGRGAAPAGDIDLSKPNATPLQAKWDAAAAHLKAQGKPLDVIGPRP